MKRALDRNRLSHTERVMQHAQNLAKESKTKKGTCLPWQRPWACHPRCWAGPFTSPIHACLPRPAICGKAWSSRRCLGRDVSAPCPPAAALGYFEDNRVAMWLVFSDVWNAIVEELRSIDLISNTERDNLLFVHLDIDSSIEVRRARSPAGLRAAPLRPETVQPTANRMCQPATAYSHT